MDFFLSVTGVVLIVEGLPYFAFPEKMKNLLAALPGFPNKILRVFGFCLMISGLILAYVAKTMR